MPAPTPLKQPPKESYTIQSLANLPCTQILTILRSDAQLVKALGLKAEDRLIKDATDSFMDSLDSNPSVRQRKQKLGDRLFKVLRPMGLKNVVCIVSFTISAHSQPLFPSQPKLVISLLDNEDLRALAHIEASFPAVFKEKATMYYNTPPSK